jgi:hypothetical protein
MSKLFMSALALALPLSLAAAPAFAASYDQAARGASNYEQRVYAAPDRSLTPSDRSGYASMSAYDVSANGAANIQQNMDRATTLARGSHVVAPRQGLTEPPAFALAARPA